MTPRRINIALDGCICRKPDCAIPYGECHCGCSGKVGISSYTDLKLGYVSGKPRLYLRGHSHLPRASAEQAPLEIKGARFIPLTKGQWAIVSAHRYEHLMQWKWCAVWQKSVRGFYAIRNLDPNKNGRRGTISMHRQILGLMHGDAVGGDHKNPSKTLDNRDVNLRFANRTQQQQNRRKQSNNTSGYKGVSFAKGSRKWAARIKVNGKYLHLGLFNTPELAYAAYCAAAIKYFGEFACIV